MQTNTVAFITGANRGLGLETARALAKKGITVVLGVREFKKGEPAAQELRATGAKVEVLQCDVANFAHHQVAYDYFAKHHGKLDILVNNAGCVHS